MSNATLTFPEAMKRAIAAYEHGRLSEADDLARAILGVRPDYFDALHLIAVINARQRRFDEALASYDRALALWPDHFPALTNRGVTLHELRRFDEALASYDRALAMRPDYAEALFHRGITLQELKRFEEALVSHDRALALQPDQADAFSNRGDALRQLKRFDEALASYDRALALKADYFDALNNRGVTLHELKRFAEALASYDRALALRSDHGALNNRGITLHELKRFDEALASYDRALALQPDQAEAFSNRGNALRKLKRLNEALASYDQALALKPDYFDALNNRGVTLYELKRFAQALASYDRALALRPDHIAALTNRGVTLHELERFDEALASYDRALALRPDYAEAFFNRGVTLHLLRQVDAALVCYDHALTVNPDHVDGHFNKALLCLLKGDYETGWREYEWRWRRWKEEDFTSKRDFAQPLWFGQTAIEGKTILLHAEQGFGDTIQFCRYAPLVAGRGARVLLEVPVQLKELMVSVAGVAEIVAGQDKPLVFDLHCPLLSLPLAFGTRLDSIPAQVPYFTVPPESLRKWTSAVGPKRSLRIGLVWSGGSGHKGDAIRSISLRSLLPLADLDAEFVSLQKEVRGDDATALKERGDIVHFGDELNTFADTAAVIANLDLVISVDTGVAHLAGALAKPVWILLPFLPDFRWLLDREDSPWYPTARLFRQQTPGDWPGVISRVVIELEKAIAGLPQRGSA